jgi:hypothetical protein
MNARLLVLTAALAAAALAASPAPAAGIGPCSGASVARTSSYVLSLVIGPRQEMYMPSDVQERNLKSGQVMLGGEMSMNHDAAAGTRIYDLAVHICTKTGAVATKLKPTIRVVDPKQMGGAMAMGVPVAIMASIAKGIRDYHYGNDVALTPGARVTVTVTVKGQRAVLHATVPTRA